MKQDTKVVIGLDLGDSWSVYSVVDGEGAELDKGRVRTNREAFQRHFGSLPASKVVMEAGAQSPWASRVVAACGHRVVVANPRALGLIYGSTHKSDLLDAQRLAELGRISSKLLSPVDHRSEEQQADLEMLRARALLVEQRTALVNHVRAVVKSFGGRLPACSTPSFVKRVADSIPAALRPALDPLLGMLEQLTREIAAYDRQVEQLGSTKYPETSRLRQVTGVGGLTALCYVLTLSSAARFSRSRTVGAYVGLAPRKDSSGASDPQRGITKAGNRELRVLLMQCAHYILGPFGPDTDLRRTGQAIQARGGKSAKKRAVVAVARKLAVLLHRLWRTGETYEPLRQARLRGELERMAMA
jgi:transposase